MFTKFAAALALFALTAEARRGRHDQEPQYDYGPQWGVHSHYQQPYYHHGGHKSYTQATEPAHDPWSTTPNHHNRWVAPATEKPEGWYSPT